jgi:prepilin peptidase CpaA
MLEFLAIAIFAGLLIYAACSDIASLTIPNWVSIALAGAFPVMALATGVAIQDIGLHLLFGFGALAVGFFLFAANVFGGGDAKLLAATAVWTGFPGFAAFALWTAIAGGGLALLLLAVRMVARQFATHPPFADRLLKQGGGIPYGVAIMAGGLMAIPSLPLQSLTLP